MTCTINEMLQKSMLCIEVWTESLLLPTDQISDIDKSQKQLTAMSQRGTPKEILPFCSTNTSMHVLMSKDDESCRFCSSRKVPQKTMSLVP